MLLIEDLLKKKIILAFLMIESEHHCFGVLIFFPFWLLLDFWVLFLPLFFLFRSVLALDLVTDICLDWVTIVFWTKNNFVSDEVEGEWVTLAFGVLWMLWRIVSILNFLVIISFSLDAFLWGVRVNVNNEFGCRVFLPFRCRVVCSFLCFSNGFTNFWFSWKVSPFA